MDLQESILKVETLANTLTSMIDEVKVMRDEESSYKTKYLSLKKTLNTTLLKQCEVANRLGRSNANISLMRKEGKIKALLVGNTWRYPESEVVRILSLHN